MHKYPNNKSGGQRPNITTIEHEHFFIMHLINDVRPKIFVILSLRIGGKLQYKIIVTVYEIDISFELLPECRK